MRIKAASSGFFVVTVLFAVVWCADADDNQFVTDGLVSYWSFDEDSIDGNTVEDLWGSNDGTIMGNPGTVTGAVGEAMDFDGIGDYIDCGGDESLNITSDLSIEFWLNPRDDDVNRHVVSRSTWGVTGYLVQNSSPTVHGQIFVFARFVYQGDVGPEGTTEVNTWQHIVLTYDSSSLTFSIYKNGSLYNSELAEAGPIKSPPEGINFMIARYSADDTNHFDGKIDELRIYNRALTDAEVQQNYEIQEEEAPVTEPGIKGDVNGDGSVRSNDAIMALRIVAGLMEPTEDQKWAADMNGDGNVRSNDAIFILRQVAGLTI